jgi:hypothetical protein
MSSDEFRSGSEHPQNNRQDARPKRPAKGNGAEAPPPMLDPPTDDDGGPSAAVAGEATDQGEAVFEEDYPSDEELAHEEENIAASGRICRTWRDRQQRVS